MKKAFALMLLTIATALCFSPSVQCMDQSRTFGVELSEAIITDVSLPVIFSFADQNLLWIPSGDIQQAVTGPEIEIISLTCISEYGQGEIMKRCHSLYDTGGNSYNLFCNQLTFLDMSKITDTELAALKAKYKHIKVITVVVEPEVKDDKGNVTDTGESYEFAARRPDRGLISMLMPLANSGAIDEFAEKGVKNLIVGGDMEALEDGLVYMGVITQLKTLIAPAASFLKTA